MAKHTPGPWIAFAKGNTVAVGTGPNGKEVDQVVHWSGFDACHVPLAEQKANARLIAQAPAMKAALEEILDCDGIGARKVARAMLAKINRR
jgi:hypothetical protein